MLVILDRQHAGQINRLDSVGAVADVDGNGTKEIHEAEAKWTGLLSLALEFNLRAKGVKVMPISDGSYPERHARANEYAARYGGACVYLALHLNAGGGNYGAMFYDHRSAAGGDLADYIAAEMERDLDEIDVVKKIPCSPSDWTKNAYYTIKDVGRPVALCSEPLFIDNTEHQKLLSEGGIGRLAEAMVNGILKWKGLA